MALSNTTTHCVSVEGASYCGVSEGWSSRMSESAARSIVPLLTGYCVIFSVLAGCCLKKKYPSFWKSVRAAYTRNQAVMSATFACSDYPTKDYDKLFRKSCKSAANEYTTYEIKEARSFLKIPFIPAECATLPTQVGVVFMTLSLCSPIGRVLWDVVDVATDGYYFTELEVGSTLNTNISRNLHVNNAVLAFAILGALNSAVLSLVHFMVYFSSQEDKLRVHVVLATQAAGSLKILLQAGPGLLLQYFYLDRYAVGSLPWWLIAKHALTAAVVLWPLKNVLTSGWSDYLVVQYHGEKVWGSPELADWDRRARMRSARRHSAESSTPAAVTEEPLGTSKEAGGVGWARCFYLPTLLSQTLLCAVLGARFISLVPQHRPYLPRGCLEVTGAGTLLQTPLTLACMDKAGWVLAVGVPGMMVLSAGALVYAAVRVRGVWVKGAGESVNITTGNRL